MRKGLFAVLLLALSGSVAAETHVLVIERMAFAPVAGTLKAGDVIEWRNDDDVPHTATAADGSFDLVLAPGERGRSVIASSGRLDVVCRYHPGMRTVLLVTQ